MSGLTYERQYELSEMVDLCNRTIEQQGDEGRFSLVFRELPPPLASKRRAFPTRPLFSDMPDSPHGRIIDAPELRMVGTKVEFSAREVLAWAQSHLSGAAGGAS